MQLDFIFLFWYFLAMGRWIWEYPIDVHIPNKESTK